MKDLFESDVMALPYRFASGTDRCITIPAAELEAKLHRSLPNEKRSPLLIRLPDGRLIEGYRNRLANDTSSGTYRFGPTRFKGKPGKQHCLHVIEILQPLWRGNYEL